MAKPAHLHRGKVRDIYAVGEDKLLVIQTDRLSAFDVILDDPIRARRGAHRAVEFLVRRSAISCPTT